MNYNNRKRIMVYLVNFYEDGGDTYAIWGPRKVNAWYGGGMTYTPVVMGLKDVAMHLKARRDFKRSHRQLDKLAQTRHFDEWMLPGSPVVNPPAR